MKCINNPNTTFQLTLLKEQVMQKWKYSLHLSTLITLNLYDFLPWNTLGLITGRSIFSRIEWGLDKYLAKEDLEYSAWARETTFRILLFPTHWSTVYVLDLYSPSLSLSIDLYKNKRLGYSQNNSPLMFHGKTKVWFGKKWCTILGEIFLLMVTSDVFTRKTHVFLMCSLFAQSYLIYILYLTVR